MTQPNDTTAEPSNITEPVIVTDNVTEAASLENTTKSNQFAAACVPIQEGQSFFGSGFSLDRKFF